MLLVFMWSCWALDRAVLGMHMGFYVGIILCALLKPNYMRSLSFWLEILIVTHMPTRQPTSSQGAIAITTVLIVPT